MSITEIAKYPLPTFTEPSPHGYVYAGFSVDPPSRVPFVRPSTRRAGALRELTRVAGELQMLPGVANIRVFETSFIPPLPGIPRWDVLMLIHTTSPGRIGDVQNSAPYRRLRPDFVMTARNIRRIGDTENTHTGTILFNHFVSSVPNNDQAIATWEDLTRWYTTTLAVDNATLLEPIGASPYEFVNYVRVPTGPARFMVAQFIRPSFHSLVRGNLAAHSMTALPMLCTPVYRAAGNSRATT